MKCKVVLLVLLILQSISALAEDAGNPKWMADYEVATKLAAEQKRRIFVLFTNSKSCAPCIILKKSVLTKKEFTDYADKHLVLLEVDYAPYHDKDAKMELNEIEQIKKVPKELWMKGRGPWPYLFVMSPEKEILYSGPANGENRAEVAGYLEFLDGLKAP